MSEKIGKIYTPEVKKGKETEEVKIDIPREDWESIEIIAKRVGGDFGMEVKLGNPGEGSFFDLETCSITFDPLHIKENLEQAKFVAGHEGAHRAITPGPKEMGLSLEKIRELYSQIGFGYIQNAIEDPAVNDWMRKRFPGLEPYITNVYDEQLKEENVVLSTPEVQRIALRLGYWPRFAQYGSEVIRYWHQERFSEKLDPAVKIALERTIEYARESISIIPDPQKLDQDRKEIVDIARRRFKNNTEWIWPEVKKLVEMDLHTEEQRQMLQEFRQKQKELEQKRKEMEQAQKEGNQQKQKELQKEIEELEKELDPFNGLSEDVKKELQEQIDKAIKEIAEKLDKEIEEKQKQEKETKQKQEELDKEIKDLEEKAKSAIDKEKEELKNRIQEKKAEKLSQAMKQKQVEQELKDIQDALTDFQDGKQIPYPIDKLSQETKQELEKLFNKLPKEKQKELRDKAEKQLEDFEDALNKELEGKLNKDKPESHKERREREKAERKAAQRSREAKEEMEKLEKELERIRKEKMNEYEKIRSEVAVLIDDLYYRLRKILIPEEYGGEELGWPSGKELDITRAMQAEKDILQKEKMWIRETAPGKKDYRFLHLVDVSGSMSGEKIKETLKGLIVAVEAIDRIENLNSENLTIHQEVTAFSNDVLFLKGFRERFSKEIAEKLSGLLDLTIGGTNTYEGTLRALEDLKKNLGSTGNFLLTFSDGVPNYDIREKLKEILKNKEGRKGIKVGLIWLGESGSEEDLQNLVQEYGYDFGIVMPAIKPRDPKEKNFAEKLADLLEDIVKNPEKY
jgi:hypothetical protein